MADLESVKEVLAQNPYTPVCLMTEIVAGTAYEKTLDTFRDFRDKAMKEKGGEIGVKASEYYYQFSTVTAPLVRAHPQTKKILLPLYSTLYKITLELKKRGLF